MAVVKTEKFNNNFYEKVYPRLKTYVSPEDLNVIVDTYLSCVLDEMRKGKKVKTFIGTFFLKRRKINDVYDKKHNYTYMIRCEMKDKLKDELRNDEDLKKLFVD